jgi:hypothetical protein
MEDYQPAETCGLHCWPGAVSKLLYPSIIISPVTSTAIATMVNHCLTRQINVH